MESQVDVAYNPWTSDDSAVALRNAIKLAEKTGHIFKKEEVEECTKTRLEEMPSMKMIQLQKSISLHNEQMNKVNFDIQRRMLYHETKDITDMGIIEKRTKEMKKLADNLQLVISNKEALITRLQQPHVGAYIKLEAAFHRHASEFFCQLAPLLSDLTSHLDDLSWVNTNAFSASQLDNLVTELSSTLASLQTRFQSISQMSQCIHSLHSVDDSHTAFDLH
ncbi:uncharacterized protein LOC143293158 [Babylonia areolata]|uniref:uncharacterized protein LOC143293158 n=1 Tax=Babylonia areolata TaxID=304850 RepID=UPI003FD4DDA6